MYLSRLIIIGALAGVALLASTPATGEPFLWVSSSSYDYTTLTYDIHNSVFGSEAPLTREFSERYSVDSYVHPDDPLQTLLVDYSGSGSASYGRLAADISATYTGGELSPLVASQVVTRFVDSLTFTTLDGSGGTALLSFAVHGSGSGRDDPTFAGIHYNSWGGFGAGRVGDPLVRNYPFTTDSEIDLVILSQPIPFESGVPVLIEAELGAVLTAWCQGSVFTLDCLGGLGGWRNNVRSDFGHTATLSGIALLNQEGAAIENFTISAESGTRYTARGVVPEPHLIFLFSSGVVGVLWRRRSLTQSRRE